MSWINYVHLCQSFQCLPRSGGLMDQDFLFVLLMQQVTHADQVKADHEAKKNADRH